MIRRGLKYYFLVVWVTLLGFSCYGQKNDTYNKRWEEINKGIKYGSPNRMKGPTRDYIYPGQLDEGNANDPPQYNTQPPDENIIYSREKRYINGTNNGIKQNIKKEEEQKLNDLKTPESKAPSIDFPKWKGPNWTMGDVSIFKFIFILIIIILVAFLIYYFLFKNRTKSSKPLSNIDYNSAADINPETIKEDQLTTEIEKAIAEGNYRLAVRLNYILLLKTLIEHNWIKWAKRKTNTHYLIEMSGKKEYAAFDQVVRIYEWSWYGKNNPSSDAYQRFTKFFDDFLNQLRAKG